MARGPLPARRRRRGPLGTEASLPESRSLAGASSVVAYVRHVTLGAAVAATRHGANAAALLLPAASSLAFGEARGRRRHTAAAAPESTAPLLLDSVHRAPSSCKSTTLPLARSGPRRCHTAEPATGTHQRTRLRLVAAGESATTSRTASCSEGTPLHSPMTNQHRDSGAGPWRQHFLHAARRPAGESRKNRLACEVHQRQQAGAAAAEWSIHSFSCSVVEGKASVCSGPVPLRERERHLEMWRRGRDAR